MVAAGRVGAVGSGAPWRPIAAHEFLALRARHRQSFLALAPIDAFRVDLPAFAAQRHRQTPIAPAYARSNQLTQPPFADRCGLGSGKSIDTSLQARRSLSWKACSAQRATLRLPASLTPFFQRLPQNVLVQRQVRDQRLQLAVLVAQLPHLTDAHRHPGFGLLPRRRDELRLPALR